MSPNDDYMAALVAQVSYWLSKGNTWSSVLSLFREKYPDDPIANLYEAQGQAEQRAANSRAYNRLPRNEQLGFLLPPGSDIFQEYAIRFNVYVPTNEGRPRWLTIIVNATPTMTRAEIEQAALEAAQQAVEQPGKDYNTRGQEYEGEPVVQVGGIAL